MRIKTRIILSALLILFVKVQAGYWVFSLQPGDRSFWMNVDMAILLFLIWYKPLKETIYVIRTQAFNTG